MLKKLLFPCQAIDGTWSLEKTVDDSVVGLVGGAVGPFLPSVSKHIYKGRGATGLCALIILVGVFFLHPFRPIHTKHDMGVAVLLARSVSRGCLCEV